jgi:hypothetical protein
MAATRQDAGGDASATPGAAGERRLAEGKCRAAGSAPELPGLSERLIAEPLANPQGGIGPDVLDEQFESLG